MNTKELAACALKAKDFGFDIALESRRRFGSSELQVFRTVGLWPEEVIAILLRGDDYVVCHDDSRVADCVATLIKTIDKETLLEFITTALPYRYRVLDKVPIE